MIWESPILLYVYIIGYIRWDKHRPERMTNTRSLTDTMNHLGNTLFTSLDRVKKWDKRQKITEQAKVLTETTLYVGTPFQ